MNSMTILLWNLQTKRGYTMNYLERMAKSLIWKPATLRKRSKSEMQLARLVRKHGAGAKVADVIKGKARS